MARPRKLLSLVEIAQETGISYATLRTYAWKHGDEIPAEGTGRNRRYPREAVPIFARLRRESRPGRKPRTESPLAEPASHDDEESAPLIREVTAKLEGIERELGAIRDHLGSIAKSLEVLVSGPKVEPSPLEAPREKEAAPPPAAREAEGPGDAAERDEPAGQRRLHTLPKVWGRRGRRPE